MQVPHTHEQHDPAHENAQHWFKVALLLGLGLYFVYNILSGNLSNYINVRFAWLSYLAAGLFLLLGGYSVYHLLRHHNGEHAHNHSHAPLSWGALLVVAIPLMLGTLIPSRPLGVEAVDGDLGLSSGVVTASSVNTFTTRPENRNVLDWLRVINSSEDYAVLNGQPADVIGFVYSEPSFGENQFMVARFTVSCCVADASAIGLPAYWIETDSLEQGQWVRVQGTMQVASFRDDDMPVLQASSVERVEQPEHPYLYP